MAARAAYERVATPAALFVTPVTRRGPRRSGGADPGRPAARGRRTSPTLVDDHLVALRPFVRQLVADWRPDVIHAHTGLPDGAVAAEIGRDLSIPVLVTEHASTIETELADPAALERYRMLLEPGVRLLAVSPSAAERLAGLLGVPVDRIEVLPNPVSDDVASAGRSGRARPGRAAVGRLARRAQGDRGAAPRRSPGCWRRDARPPPPPRRQRTDGRRPGQVAGARRRAQDRRSGQRSTGGLTAGRWPRRWPVPGFSFIPARRRRSASSRPRPSCRACLLRPVGRAACPGSWSYRAGTGAWPTATTRRPSPGQSRRRWPDRCPLTQRRRARR